MQLPQTSSQPSASPLQIVNAHDIYTKDFPPVNWFAKPILHEGATLLSGDPKVGKSFLALQIALAIAGSDPTVLGSLQVETHGRVLYLAFDDGNQRRLHDRLHQLSTDIEAIKNIDVVYRETLPTLSNGLCVLVDQHLSHTKYGAVILDTLGSVQSVKGNKGIYQAEYLETILLQQLAVKHGICLLIVHHTNKSVGTGSDSATNNPVGRASGSHGLTGAVDSVLLLCSSGGGGAKLISRPRDGEETEHSLTRLGTGGWIIGVKSPVNALDALKNLASRANSFASPGAGNPILDALGSGPKTKKDLASVLGIKEEAIRKRVDRLGKDKVQKLPDGRYALACVSGTSCPSA